MFCVSNFSDLTFSFSELSISSTISSLPEILPSVYVLLVKLSSVVPVQIPKIFNFKISLVYVSFIAFSTSGS